MTANLRIARPLMAAKPSPSIAAKARVDALRAEGREIVDFTVGEPDFQTPAHIVEAGKRALDEGQTKYTSSLGTPALRKAVAAKLLRENGLSYDVQDVIVGVGAKNLIFNALAATLEAGDEVIVPAPCWVSYPDMVTLNGGTPVIVDCPESQGFKLAPEALEQAITANTRWLVLNTPGNPTGAVYTAGELEALARVLDAHPQVWVLTDEIYEHFVYDEGRHRSILTVAPGLKARTLLINGVSKAYAMTGWRIGYAAGPRELMKVLALLATQTMTCASAMSQAAAVAALDGDQACVRSAAALFQSRRDLMIRRLQATDGIACQSPAGAFYVFANVQGLLGKRRPDTGAVLQSDVDVSAYLLDRASVATIDGQSYGLSLIHI